MDATPDDTKSMTAGRSLCGLERHHHVKIPRTTSVIRGTEGEKSTIRQTSWRVRLGRIHTPKPPGGFDPLRAARVKEQMNELSDICHLPVIRTRPLLAFF